MATSTAEAKASSVPRLKAFYRTDIVPALTEAFSYTNPHQVPGLVKVVVNTGVGEAARDSKVIEGAIRDLTQITGQKPVKTSKQCRFQILDVVNMMERHFDGAELSGVVTEIDKLFSQRFDSLVSSLDIGKPPRGPGGGNGHSGGGRRPRHLH